LAVRRFRVLFSELMVLAPIAPLVRGRVFSGRCRLRNITRCARQP